MSESTTITQIQTHIEELEKRIKSLSVALGANSQLQAVKSILEEIKELLEAYSAELVELSDSTEELQSSTKQNIESVNSKLAELESAVTNIKVKVDEIEATGGAGGGNSGKETTNWYAHKYIPMCVYGHGLITCPHIILYCEPTEKVKVKVRVRGTAASYSQYTKHEFYLNDVLVQSRAYTYVKDVDTVEEFEFYPTKSVNLIEFGSFIGVKNSQTKELCVIYDMDFEFYGRNVTVLNRNHDLKVFTYNNKTYVTRHHAEEGMEFLIYDPSTIDLSLEGQPITKEEESSYWGFHEMLVPQTAKTSGQNTAYIPDENMFYVYKVSKNNGTEMGLIDISAETPTITGKWLKYIEVLQYNICNNIRGISHATFDEAVIKAVDMSPWLLAVDSNTSESGDSPRGFAKFKFNNEYVPKALDIIGVDDNSRVDPCPMGVKNGYVILDEELYQTYYPQYNATWCIKLGKGAEATAYKQQSGNTNVYFTRFNYIYRYVVQDTDEETALVSRHRIAGITKVMETTDDKAIILQNGEYKFVTLSELEWEMF